MEIFFSCHLKILLLDLPRDLLLLKYNILKVIYLLLPVSSCCELSFLTLLSFLLYNREAGLIPNAQRKDFCLSWIPPLSISISVISLAKEHIPEVAKINMLSN